MARTFKTINDLIAQAFIRDEKTPVNAYNKLMGQGVKHTRSQKLSGMPNRMSGGRLAVPYVGDKNIYKQEVQFSREGVSKDTNPDYRSVDSNLVLFNIDKYFNNLIEEINKQLELYLNGTPSTNSGKVIFHWNELIYYLKRFLPTNLSNKDQSTINMKFDELLPSIEQLDAIAQKKKGDFIDKAEINEIMSNIQSKNYSVVKTKYSQRIESKTDLYALKARFENEIKTILYDPSLSLEDKKKVQEYAKEAKELFTEFLKSNDKNERDYIVQQVQEILNEIRSISGIVHIAVMPPIPPMPIFVPEAHGVDAELANFREQSTNIRERYNALRKQLKGKRTEKEATELFQLENQSDNLRKTVAKFSNKKISAKTKNDHRLVISSLIKYCNKILSHYPVTAPVSAPVPVPPEDIPAPFFEDEDIIAQIVNEIERDYIPLLDDPKFNLDDKDLLNHNIKNIQQNIELYHDPKSSLEEKKTFIKNIKRIINIIRENRKQYEEEGMEGDGRRRRKQNKILPTKKKYHHENKDILFPSYDFYDMAKLYEIEKQKHKKNRK